MPTSRNLQRASGLLVLFCIFTLLSLVSKPADAGIFTTGVSFRKSCEALLIELTDRKSLIQAKPWRSLELEENKSRMKSGINAWIENTRHLVAIESESEGAEAEWAEDRIVRSLTRWANLIRENLKQQGLLSAEINKGSLAWSFLLDPEAATKLYPEIGKFGLPTSYALAVTPSLWLTPAEAAMSGENKVIHLPKSILWELSDEDQITVLHETMHARLESLRAKGSFKLFPFTFIFSGELLKKMEPDLDINAESGFSPEEIAVRAVTLAYRTERLCRGEFKGEGQSGFSSDFLELFLYSRAYTRDILPELFQRDLSTSANLQFTKAGEYYELKSGRSGFHIYLEPQAWERYFSQDPKKGLREIRQVLQEERKWIDTARTSLNFVNSQKLGAQGKKPYDWKSLCAHRAKLWNIADSLGVDLSALRAK